jgi:glycosyltransferase involved in cell wall biosynthesis
VNPNTRFTPNGVDFHAFSRPVPEPEDLAAVPRPRIGYVGFLKKQLDWVLLDALADRHPEWSFVFVGPRHDHPEIRALLDRMEGRENVHFLGAKAVGELGRYPQHFDACILPYQLDDYTRYINPLKLYEYLAAGPPIVGAPIRSLQDFRDQVLLAGGVDEWSEALSEALSPEARGAAKVESRREVARRYDWDALVEGVARELAGRLGDETLERLDRHLRCGSAEDHSRNPGAL